MGRNLTSWCGLLVGLGLALEPAHAGDRKSAGREPKAADETVMSREIQSVSLQRDVFDSPTVRPFGARYSSSVNMSPNDDESATAPGAERKPLTFFHIKSKLGDLAVQPAIGAKGVQFSLEF